MCCIMESLQQYLPDKPCTATGTLPNGDELTYDFHVHLIIMRRESANNSSCKGAQLLHSNHENKVDHLEGLLSFAENWQTRKSLLKVITHDKFIGCYT